MKKTRLIIIFEKTDINYKKLLDIIYYRNTDMKRKNKKEAGLIINIYRQILLRNWKWVW